MFTFGLKKTVPATPLTDKSTSTASSSSRGGARRATKKKEEDEAAPGQLMQAEAAEGVAKASKPSAKRTGQRAVKKEAAAAPESGDEASDASTTTRAKRTREGELKEVQKATSEKAVEEKKAPPKARRGKAAAAAKEAPAEAEEPEVEEPPAKRAKKNPASKSKKKKIGDDDEEASAASADEDDEQDDDDLEEDDFDEDEEDKPKKKTKAPAAKKTGAKRAASAKKSAKASAAAAATEGDDGEPGAPEPAQSGDFSSPQLEQGQLKIASWNVAGFAAVLKKGFKNYFEKEKPDILCLQETKIDPSKVTDSDGLAGYHRYFIASQTKGQDGTGVYTKIKPLNVTYGMGVKEHDQEGRMITLEFEEFFLVNCYVPNSGMKLQNLPYRAEWDDALRAYLKRLDAQKPVILCGDLNVAHTEIDLKNPKTNKKTPGFTEQERTSFTKTLKDLALVDAYRAFYKKELDCYTFWSYKREARSKDIGWRLDYFCVSERFFPKVKTVYRRKNVEGSEYVAQTPTQPATGLFWTSRDFLFLFIYLFFYCWFVI